MLILELGLDVTFQKGGYRRRSTGKRHTGPALFLFIVTIASAATDHGRPCSPLVSTGGLEAGVAGVAQVRAARSSAGYVSRRELFLVKKLPNCSPPWRKSVFTLSLWCT